MPGRLEPGRALTLVLSSFVVACAAGDKSNSGPNGLVRRDSAGITIVENAAPSWPKGEGWQIDAVPEVVIGSTRHLDDTAGPTDEAAGQVPLERVQGVRVLSDGRIVVADAGPAQVMVFDRGGALVSRFGRRGQGPGEFAGISDVHVCGGDSIVVLAPFNNLHVFDDQGRYVRQAQYRPQGGPSTIQAVSPNCGRVLIQQNGELPPLGSWGVIETILTWVDPIAPAADTVANARMLEAWTRMLYGEVRPFIVPWGTSARTYAAGKDALIIGFGRAPELRTYDQAGEVNAIYRWSAQPQPITREDRQRYADSRHEWLAKMPNHEETRFQFPELGEYPGLPTHKPLFDSILVDDESGVWLRNFPSVSLGLFDGRLPGQTWSNQTWTVFDSTGVWLGELAMPDRFDLRAVARGRVFGIVKDSLDVETVQLFRIRRPSTAPPST